RRLMTKIVNLVSAKMEMGGPMVCMYLLGNPDHYTNHTFVPFFWKRYMSSVHDYTCRPPELSEMPVYEFVRACRRVPKKLNKKGELPRNVYAFTDTHPLADTHALRINPGNVETIVPDFVGDRIPRCTSDSDGEYSAMVLSIFVPWTVGTDLRSADETWAHALSRRTLPSRLASVVKNLNLKYECLDARDDYRAQLKA
ncbi:hypothetical protein BKA70DRAFT_1532489, partial [Coprinopsis sp. MPI-PUGE-AT-0042]